MEFLTSYSESALKNVINFKQYNKIIANMVEHENNFNFSKMWNATFKQFSCVIVILLKGLKI